VSRSTAERTIYLTGVSGQLGVHVGRFLLERGHTVHGVDLVEPPPTACSDFERIDLTDAPAVAHSLLGRRFDAVIHLAALVAPTEELPQRVMSVNVSTTHNLTEAARAAGAPRLIYMSSESVLGFAFPVRRPPLERVPITESHPLRAQDAYGLSKLLGERISRAYHDTTGTPVVCLRPPWVWIPEKVDVYRELVADPSAWAHALWAYVVIDDLCDLVVRALEVPECPGLELFATAPDNGTSEPTRQLLKGFYDFVGPFDPSFGPDDSVICSRRAQDVLGWRPRWTWRHWLDGMELELSTAGGTRGDA
jgi:nucleoside-diphosphate-sugar epimerase